MEIKLTAVFRKFQQRYAAFVEELPGANTQGTMLEEARENLKEAVAMPFAIPRHREIIEFLAQKICKDPDIPKP
jgi:predicted RNase H-like HicB family nuclease